MKSQEIRKKFTEFFKEKEHLIVPSASMVLKDDPTLMFVNSGMAPFKEYFLGNAVPKSNRIADTQKCLRVSGKHNDLEEVGYDTYHHTLFEMLGNWSFGDYFKEEAIKWAWELLTEVYNIDKDILYVTVFEGDSEDGLPMDSEAYDIWNKLIPKERILKGNKKDNFWEMGEQGPCGPCSEIHVDIRAKEEKALTPGKDLVNMDHPEVVEIWNLVFMQYNRKADGRLEQLPAKHIDTGMGFERLCMVLQGVRSNYDTDVFTPIIKEIETITNTTYGKDKETDVAIRVISDHLRAVAFSIADGQLPSNTGAGYVIRRILRRAIRYGFTFLDQQKPFIYRLINVLSELMGGAFPELISQKQLIENVIKEEEQSFLRTLDQGLLMLNDIIAKSKNSEISGKKAFILYDTFGFPIDLTALILRENGLTYNEKEFNEEMMQQKFRSRAASEISTDDWVVLDRNKNQEFVGYDLLETQVKITSYRKVSSKKDGIRYQLVFNKTPFYPEGGGQVGDCGFIKGIDKQVLKILGTKKENNVIIHITDKLPKDFDQEFTAVVDQEKRYSTMANHTATHLLHQALRQILGTHVEQKGSAVNSKYLRFDFSHFSKLSTEELIEIENFVNARISASISLEEERDIPIKKAMDQGAMALFGEKYGDAVRTIRFEDSIELCGGTHVKNTSDIWFFKILSEGAVASGIRRIEAITGKAVKDYLFNNNRQYLELKHLLNNSKDPVSSLKSLQEDNTKLQKEIESLLKEKAKNIQGDLLSELKEKNGIKYLFKKLDLDVGGLKDISFEIGQKYNNLILLFGSEQNGKALLSCYISKALVDEKNLNAGKIVRELGKYIQGGGGGQPFYATAGGKNPDGIELALEKAMAYIT